MGGKIAGKNTGRYKVRLTKKQTALAKAAVAAPDAPLHEIGRKAGYKGDNATVSSAAGKALKSANVQERFRALMAKRPKLQHKALLEKLEEGLDATATKFFPHEGRVVDQEEVIDYGTRHSYLTLATKLQGLGSDKLEVTGAGGKDLIPQAEPIAAIPQLTKQQLLDLIASPEPKAAAPAKEAKAA